MNWITMNMSAVLAEDVGAPELRNPRAGGMRKTGVVKRLLSWSKRRAMHR